MIKSVGGACSLNATPTFQAEGGAAVMRDSVELGGAPEALGTYGPNAARPAGLPQLDEKSQALADAARNGLAQKLGVKPEALRLTGFANFETGPSLGISERGMGGAAVMVDAYKVSFRQGDDRYEYRAACGSKDGMYVAMPEDGFATYFHQDARGIYVPDPPERSSIW